MFTVTLFDQYTRTYERIENVEQIDLDNTAKPKMWRIFPHNYSEILKQCSRYKIARITAE